MSKPENELGAQALAEFQTKITTFAEQTLTTDAQRNLLAAILKIARDISTEEPADEPAFSADFAASFTPSQAQTIIAAATSAQVFHSDLISRDSVGPAGISRDTTPSTSTLVSHLLISRSSTDEPPDDPTAHLISR